MASIRRLKRSRRRSRLPRRLRVAHTTSVLQIVPVAPALGADVYGVDLTERLDDDVFAVIHQAYLQYGVLFFREQRRLEPAQQVDFGRRFGELHVHPAAPTLERHPEIFVIHTHRDSRVANGELWHSDVSCDEAPPSGTMLQIHTLPDVGGDTLWISTAAAFAALSEPVRELLVTLRARHSSEHVYRGRYADRGVDDTGRQYPSAVHPMVAVHPETGVPCLFVNRSFTTRIQGLSAHESSALLNMCFQHLEQPRFGVRHRWRQNDVALWDNRQTQHMALWDYHPHERKGHRVTIAGTRPVGLHDDAVDDRT